MTTVFPKNIRLSEKEELRAEITRRRGRPYVDLRVWAAPTAGESKWPTGKGIQIPANDWSELQTMLTELGAELKGLSIHE